jgi:hypothetical protein
MARISESGRRRNGNHAYDKCCPNEKTTNLHCEVSLDCPAPRRVDDCTHQATDPAIDATKVEAMKQRCLLARDAKSFPRQIARSGPLTRLSRRTPSPLVIEGQAPGG